MAKHGDSRARIPSTPRVEVEVAELSSACTEVCELEVDPEEFTQQGRDSEAQSMSGSADLHSEAGDRFQEGLLPCGHFVR